MIYHDMLDYQMVKDLLRVASMPQLSTCSRLAREAVPPCCGPWPDALAGLGCNPQRVLEMPRLPQPHIVEFAVVVVVVVVLVL